jgi:putative DNA methylase
MPNPKPYKKKLIEVALPLEAINIAASREKSIRHGHPSTLHLWWARRPLAACRAVLFASLVDDPSALPEPFPTEDDQQRERQRLFGIIEDLVQWENSNNPAVLAAARAEILRSTDGHPPPVLDPFAGGGSIPLEAQRLGLEAHASDLNPVAVLINKALIEIPPQFANQPPINPDYAAQSSEAKAANADRWQGARGLAEDVRYYGQWMRDEAEKRIGHLYPKVQAVRQADGRYRHATPDEIENQQSQIQNLTVIAWLWARTVVCPNPACQARIPLVRSFALSTKKGKRAWVVPRVVRVDGQPPSVVFEVAGGEGETPAGTVNRKGARCLCCGTPVPFEHVRAEGQAGRMGAQLMAIVAEGSCVFALQPGVGGRWNPHARARCASVNKPNAGRSADRAGRRV